MTLRILAIDTCTEACSAALLVGEEIQAKQFIAPREHAKLLLPTLQSLLAEAELSLNQLDAIAFGRGPGSFTGVRIGTATAQGLAFGADLPVLPISTLQALAQQGYRLSGKERQFAAIDARMNEVYCGLYQLADQHMQPVQAEQVCAPAQAMALISDPTHTWYGVGSGWAAYAEQMSGSAVEAHPEDLFPLAQDMAYLSQFAWQQGQAIDAELAQPVYLRDTVTWKKLPGK